MNTTYWLSQTIVVIAYIILGVGLRKETRLQILTFSSLYQTLMIVHFSLLLGTLGVIAGIIALLRNFLFSYNEKRSKSTSAWILVLFSLITITLTFFFYKSSADILPCILTLIGIYSYWSKNTKVTRIGNLIISICYISYAISVCSWFLIICELYLIVNTIIGYYQHEKSTHKK